MTIIYFVHKSCVGGIGWIQARGLLCSSSQMVGGLELSPRLNHCRLVFDAGIDQDPPRLLAQNTNTSSPCGLASSQYGGPRTLEPCTWQLRAPKATSQES